jgi:glucosyl-dolichyl phosphate glucuronosyltransferase
MNDQVNMMDNPRLSIVVCTYQRPDHLARLLGALKKQTVAPKEYEIVAVDNEASPNPQVMTICNSAEYKELVLHYFHHARAGISSARNRGVQEARAEWVAFLDDDVIPPPEWVSRELAIIASSKVEIFGGPGTPFYTSTPPKWFKDSYAGLKTDLEPHWRSKNKPLAGFNFTCRKELIIRLGGFSEDFGYVGGKKRFGDDNDFCQRAQNEGIGLWFDPGLTLQHHFEAERMSLRWYLTTIMHHSQMKAHILLRDKRATDTRPVFRQILSISKKLLVQTIRFIVVCCLSPFRNREQYPYPENYAIEKIGPELRQVTLLFEMIYVLIFNSEKIRVGLR